MTLAAVSTFLSLSITLLTIVLVVVSLLIILVVMMQRPKQEGLGAAFGGGMTDQLLGAGTTSFLQKATVVLGILFFLLSLILGILVGKSNKERGLDVQEAVPAEANAAPAPGIADGVQLEGDFSSDDEENIMKAIREAGLEDELGVSSPEGETAPEESAPSEESAPEAPATDESAPTEESSMEEAPAESANEAPAEEESAPADSDEQEPETEDETSGAE